MVTGCALRLSIDRIAADEGADIITFIFKLVSCVFVTHHQLTEWLNSRSLVARYQFPK